jgi:hypothetical protein
LGTVLFSSSVMKTPSYQLDVTIRAWSLAAACGKLCDEIALSARPHRDGSRQRAAGAVELLGDVRRQAIELSTTTRNTRRIAPQPRAVEHGDLFD